MYVTIHTWLDIIFILNWLSQYLSNSTEHYEHAFKKLLQYIKSIINFNIMYSFSESQVILKYFNFNYASDKQNWKSILKCVYMFKDKLML